MATERKRRRPTPATKPVGPEASPEKDHALMGVEEWYREVTKREDIREILTELAK